MANGNITARTTVTDGRQVDLEWSPQDEAIAMRIADSIAYMRQREYTNWFGMLDRYKLRQLISDVVLTVIVFERQAATQTAYEQSAQLADRRDSSCDPRTEAEQTAHDIARDIRALAAREAGKGRE